MHLGNKDTVRRFNGNRPALHRKIFLIIMNFKDGDRVALMIQRHDMSVIRKKVYCFWIISTDRKDADLIQESRVQIYMEQSCCIVTRIGTQHLGAIS